MYVAMINMLTSQLSPLFRTINWQTTNPSIFPKLGQVAQNPSKVVSLSGDQTECTNGSKLGHMNDCKYPLRPIKMTSTANAPEPYIFFIETGTRQY